MTSKKQSVVIYVLVGTMLLGVVGTAAAAILSSNSQEQEAEQLQELLACSSPFSPAGEPIEAPEKPVIIKERISELDIIDIKVGTGEVAKEGDCIVVHYQGHLTNNGVIFDSSYERGQPITIALDEVIEGWQQGVPGMKVGGIRRLVVPGELGYGEQGSPAGGIGPNQPLTFVVELIDIQE